MPLKGLRGKRALVTGAASGIGAAVCERLKREGVQVIATDIHPAPDAIVADLTDSDDVERLSARAGTPGFIKTPRIAEADWGQVTQAFIDGLPLRRAGKPDDIAGVVAMLCSDAGGYVSGATIDVNGGWYFGP